MVICGTVRTPARASDYTYEYLNPDSYSQDDISAQKYECIVSPYYSYKDAVLYANVT